jgi:hypothetical protein
VGQAPGDSIAAYVPGVGAIADGGFLHGLHQTEPVERRRAKLDHRRRRLRDPLGHDPRIEEGRNDQGLKEIPAILFQEAAP